MGGMVQHIHIYVQEAHTHTHLGVLGCGDGCMHPFRHPRGWGRVCKACGERWEVVVVVVVEWALASYMWWGHTQA
jgi:hypothetical protein